MTNFNIFMLFSVSYKTVPHYLMMNLNMCVLMISLIENTCTCVENFWKDTQKIANCDYLWKLVAKISRARKSLLFILSISLSSFYVCCYFFIIKNKFKLKTYQYIIKCLTKKVSYRSIMCLI